MADFISKDNVIDNYIEHDLHTEKDENCSTCFSEAVTCGHGTLYPTVCSLCASIHSKCKECDGTGELTTLERVWADEPHIAPIGTAKCFNCAGTGIEPNEQVILARIYDL